MNSELPEGWAVCRVEEAFHSFGGGTPAKATPSYWGGGIPWLSSGDIKTDRIRSASETITKAGLAQSSASLCRPGSVLVVVRSGILKHTLPVAVLEREAAINQDIKCFDSGSIELNRWLALGLKASAKQILALNREGTTVQSVKYETLKDFELRVPPPTEQRRIVAKLEMLTSKIDANRERLQKLSAALGRLRHSIVAAACSGRLTVDRHRQSPDEISTDDIPGGWKAVSVGEVIESLKYGTAQKCDYSKGGVPVLRIPNVVHGIVDHEDLKYARLAAGEREQLRLIPGDILLIRSNGSASLVGRTALVREQEQGFAYAGYLIRVRPFRAIILPEFLNLVLGSFDIRVQIELEARSTSGVHNINGDEVRALRFALPPLDEQREIMKRVEALSALADQIEGGLRRVQTDVERLAPSVLAKAFRGELVPTEADLVGNSGRGYESASALLERVQRDLGRESGPDTTARAGRRTPRKTPMQSRQRGRASADRHRGKRPGRPLKRLLRGE